MRPEAIHRREIDPEQILSAEEQTGADPGLCGSEHGRLVKAAEGRGIIGGRAPLTGITLVLEPPWCRSPTCSPPWTGSPTPAAARDGATRWPTRCCSRGWPSSRAPPPAPRAARARSPAPRRRRGRRSPLAPLLLFSVLAVLAGAPSYRGILVFIAVHRERLNAVFRAALRRAPAVNTLRALFLALDPAELEAAFRRHAGGLGGGVPAGGPRGVAPDGETPRRGLGHPHEPA